MYGAMEFQCLRNFKSFPYIYKANIEIEGDILPPIITVLLNCHLIVFTLMALPKLSLFYQISVLLECQFRELLHYLPLFCLVLACLLNDIIIYYDLFSCTI